VKPAFQIDLVGIAYQLRDLFVEPTANQDRPDSMFNSTKFSINTTLATWSSRTLI